MVNEQMVNEYSEISDRRVQKYNKNARQAKVFGQKELFAYFCRQIGSMHNWSTTPTSATLRTILKLIQDKRAKEGNR